MAAQSLYKPVSCDIHSQLELLIMHGKRLQVEYIHNDDIIKQIITPHDIVTRKDKGEFLLATNDSEEALEIRLDTLKYFQAL